MATFNECNFSGNTIGLDDNVFERNSFKDCVLVYGGGPLTFIDNSLENVKFNFIGSAARTLAFISQVYEDEDPDFLEKLFLTFGKSVK